MSKKSIGGNTTGQSVGKQIRNLIGFGAGICIVVVLFIHLNRNASITNLLQHVSIPKVIAICLVGFVVNAITIAVIQLYMTGTLGCRLTFWESFALSIVSRSGNTLTPFRLGTVYRVMYLKQNHNLLLLQFGSMFVGLQLVLILTASLVCGVTLGILSFTCRDIQLSLVLIFFMIVFMCIVLLFRPVSPGTSQNWIGRKLTRFVEGWQLLQQDKKIFWIAISGRMIGLIVNAMLFYLILLELGEEIELMVCLFFSSITSLTLLIQLIPGSLGITESVVTVTAVLFGLPATIGFSSSLIMRLANILFLIVLTLPSWVFLEKLKTRRAGKCKIMVE